MYFFDARRSAGARSCCLSTSTSSFLLTLFPSGSILCFAESFSYTTAQAYIGYAWAPDVFARIFLGYLIYDATAMIAFYSTLKDPAGLFHHLLFIPAASYVLAHSIMAFPFVWLSWCEVSTPFVNYRWHLAATGRKGERVYALNAVLVGALFFIARVLCYGAGLFDLLAPTRRALWGGPGQPFGHKAVVALFAVGWALNLYWFNLIVKAAVRAVRPAAVSASTRSHDDRLEKRRE